MSVRLQISDLMVWADATCSVYRMEMPQRCVLHSRGSQWLRAAWLPPTLRPTIISVQWQEISYLLQSLGQLLLQVLLSLLFLQTLQSRKQNGRFPSKKEKRKQNWATNRADQLAWASGNNKGQEVEEVGGIFPFYFKLLAVRDLSRVNCSILLTSEISPSIITQAVLEKLWANTPSLLHWQMLWLPKGCKLRGFEPPTI